MQFVQNLEAEAFFKRLGIGPSGLVPGTARRFKSDEFYYTSRLATAPQVGALLVEALGDFAEAMIWPHGIVFGDRSHDADAPADWVAYRQWRDGHGATTRLYDEPGHLFVSTERDDLRRLLELAIYLGWDALVGSRQSKVLIALSHHDSITFHSRSRPTHVMARLQKLGVRGPV